MFMNDESSKCPVPKSFVDHFLTSLLISECILCTAINRQPSCGPKGPRRVTRVINIFSTSFIFFAARRISSLFTSMEVPTSSVDATRLLESMSICSIRDINFLSLAHEKLIAIMQTEKLENNFYEYPWGRHSFKILKSSTYLIVWVPLKEDPKSAQCNFRPF